MTALDLINKFNKDVWNHTDRMFGDTFDNKHVMNDGSGYFYGCIQN